jgi:hypothetical protein
MKKVYFILILLISFTAIEGFSQTTEELDKRNGFQDFKFNTPKEAFTSYGLKQINENQYEVQKLDAVKIGDFELEKLELFFKNNRLIKVKVTLDDTDRTKNEYIFNALIKNYGRYTYHRSSSGFQYTSEMIWKGKAVNLVYTFTSMREGMEFKTKIYLTYSHIGESLEVDITKDL